MKKSQLTEKELLLAAQHDEDAFASLYERYHNLVYYVAYQMCRNDADAQDVVQETFMEVRRSLGNLKNPQYFRLWLYRIIDSKCKKLFRKNKYACTDIEQDHILNEFLELNEQYLPEAQSKYKSDRDLMYSFIKKLPYDQKYAILLYYMEQLTTAEIAGILQIPEGTVKSRLSVARSGLRKHIEAYEHREGVKLNFHEGFGGAAIMAAILRDSKKGLFCYKARDRFRSLQSSVQSASLSMKVMLVISFVAASALSGTVLANLYHYGTQTNVTETIDFPLLYYRGTKIQTSKDAYYTLKMNICRQDISELSEERYREAMPLYQALKEENGVYYERLRQSGWAKEFDPY